MLGKLLDKTKKNNTLIYLLSFMIMLNSCGLQKEIVYLQDTNNSESAKIANYQGISIQSDDILSIVVYSKTPELTIPFNPTVTQYKLDGETPLTINRQFFLNYTVSKEGEIDFPTFGKLKVAGLTKEQLSTLIKDKLISENYINDPIVSVQFMNFRIYIAGEVVTPGMYEITNDRISLLEALTMAGDLTIYGKRDNVKIIREKNGERKIYTVNLTTAELFNSPAYYLQQNDYIYVEPNKYRTRDARRKQSKY